MLASVSWLVSIAQVYRKLATGREPKYDMYVFLINTCM